MNSEKIKTVGKSWNSINEKIRPKFIEEFWGKDPITGIIVDSELTNRGNRRFILAIYLSPEPTEKQLQSLNIPRSYRGVPVRTRTGPIVAADI